MPCGDGAAGAECSAGNSLQLMEMIPLLLQLPPALQLPALSFFLKREEKNHLDDGRCFCRAGELPGRGENTGIDLRERENTQGKEKTGIEH